MKLALVSAPDGSGQNMSDDTVYARDCRIEGGGRGLHLTSRQLEVLALLCEGLPNKLICRRLNISAGTVKTHISAILSELGVTSRLQAVVVAQRLGLHQLGAKRTTTQ